MDEEEIEEWFQDQREKAVEERVRNEKGLDRKEADAAYEEKFQGILAEYKRKLDVFLTRQDQLGKLDRFKKELKKKIMRKVEAFKERLPAKKHEED